MDHPPSSWHQIRGPLGAALKSLHRINWQWRSPLQFITDRGEVIALPSTSPKQLKCKVAEAWRRKLSGYAAERLSLPQGTFLDPTVGRQLLSKLSHPYGTMLNSFLVKPIRTQDRLVKAGYSVSPACALCGQTPDTLNHRLFQCPHSQELRQRRLSAATVQILNDPQQCFPLLLGYRCCPRFTVPRPEGDGHLTFDFWSADSTQTIAEAFTGEVFSDGSASYIGPPQYHTAAWAIVKLHPATAEPIAVLSGPVGQSLPPTSQAAEYVAGLAVAVHCPFATLVHTDFQGLVSLETQTIGEYAHRANYYSGIKLQIRGAAGWTSDKAFVKVKAHQSPDELAPQSREWFLAKGNEAADKAANVARAKLALPSAAEFSEHQQQSAALRELLLYASEALLLWPTPTHGSRRRGLAQTQQPSDQLQTGMLSGLEVLFQGTGPLQGTAGITDCQPSPVSVSEPLQPPQPPSSAALARGASGAGASASSAPSSASSLVASPEARTSTGGPAPRRRIRGKRAAYTAASGHPQISPPSEASESAHPLAASAVPAPPVPPPPAAPVEPARAHGIALHQWSPARIGGRWFCQICFRSSRLTEPPRHERCQGLPFKLTELLASRKGHNLSCCDTPNGIILFCTKCGCMSEGTRLAGLSSPCKNKPQSGKCGRNLSRIALRQHPNPARFGDACVLDPPVFIDSLLGQG